MRKKVIAVFAALLITTCILVGCGGSSKKDEVKLDHGELIRVTESKTDEGLRALVEAKIKYSIDNELTIEQNYYNVQYLIQDDGFDKYDAIRYQAVGDMSDGTEQVWVAFNMSKDLISKVKAGKIEGFYIGDNVDDLYINYVLRK